MNYKLLITGKMIKPEKHSVYHLLKLPTNGVFHILIYDVLCTYIHIALSGVETGHALSPYFPLCVASSLRRVKSKASALQNPGIEQ
jgi:hypothetical protein